ncbi:MAG: ribonuclease HII [bacterium]|nr:ribonuclease HII [bacterium]
MDQTLVIVGIDEAGRGALAGPVVAGACVLTDAMKHHPLICDSKALDPASREVAYGWILKNCIWGFGVVDASVVDNEGILAATEQAMTKALAMVEEQIKPTYLLIDGRDKFWFPYPKSTVIRGDESEPCISAGSIVAKVTRDRLMMESDADFAQYGFASHKGYGTEEHFAAIKDHGMSSMHRKTFIHL